LRNIDNEENNVYNKKNFKYKNVDQDSKYSEKAKAS